jgi:inosine-uridine nucleoside N-ribohydrolase
MRRKLILDVDTGADDAVAIMLAALHPALELMACTTVNGNVPVRYCTANTLRVLDHIGRSDIPVYEGASRPFERADFPMPNAARESAGKLHGEVLPVPDSPRVKADQNAIEFLIETYRAATEAITLVALAPLTNIAHALTRDPGLVKRIPEIVIMGGGHAIGNITPSAEFNIWCDPEAARVVFRAGFEKLTLVPLDATHQAPASNASCAELEALGTPAGAAASRFIGRCIAFCDQIGRMPRGTAPVHDALCVAFLVDPSIITTRRAHVDVETNGELTIGRTVINCDQRPGMVPDCDVAFGADGDRFLELLLQTFA